MRQLKAQAELKSREAKDSFALARATEQKAHALEAAGLAQAGPFSALSYSTTPYSPQALQTPAMLRGLAGGSGPSGKGWLGSPDRASPQHRTSLDFSAVQGEPFARASRSRPATPAPGNKQDRSMAVEGEEEQAQLLQATWSALILLMPWQTICVVKQSIKKTVTLRNYTNNWSIKRRVRRDLSTVLMLCLLFWQNQLIVYCTDV